MSGALTEAAQRGFIDSVKYLLNQDLQERITIEPALHSIELAIRAYGDWDPSGEIDKFKAIEILLTREVARRKTSRRVSDEAARRDTSRMFTEAQPTAQSPLPVMRLPGYY